MEAALKIIGLNKHFGHKHIIKDLSMDVFSGEVFGFLGPNGAGKTTTIKMVMGFLSPDSGEIIINGSNIKDNYESAMANLGGIVENPEMYKDISGRVNLEMYARIHDGVTRERINEVVELVGMQARIDEKVKRYSLGMKQRIGLAQALLHKPKVLILDEPTNGLDPAGIKELRDILKRLAHEENTAVIVSSHQLAEMQLMCDRVAIINSGTLLAVKPIHELMDEQDGKCRCRFSSNDVLALKNAILQTAYSDLIVAEADDYIELSLFSADIPNVVRLIVNAGVDLYGVHKQEISLEAAYLNITGGGNNIA